MTTYGIAKEAAQWAVTFLGFVGGISVIIYAWRTVSRIENLLWKNDKVNVITVDACSECKEACQIKIEKESAMQNEKVFTEIQNLKNIVETKFKADEDRYKVSERRMQIMAGTLGRTALALGLIAERRGSEEKAPILDDAIKRIGEDVRELEGLTG